MFGRIGNPPGSRGYKYTDKKQLLGPCKTAKLRAAKQLKLSCKGDQITFSLDEDAQKRIAAQFSFGTDPAFRFCMEFGGKVSKDKPARDGKTGVFRATKAPAPAVCL